MGYVHQELRPYTGASVSSAAELVVVTNGTTHDFLDITGIGLLHWVLFRARAGSNSENIVPIIEADGVQLQPVLSFAMFNSYGFSVGSKPMQLLQYGADGNCVILYNFENGFAYNKSLKLSGANGTGADRVMDCFYCLTGYIS